MNPNPEQLRHARLQHECRTSAIPALLLLVACAAFGLMAAFKALTADDMPARIAEPTEQVSTPAA